MSVAAPLRDALRLELEAVSPELALVDPELAEALRSLEADAGADDSRVEQVAVFPPSEPTHSPVWHARARSARSWVHSSLPPAPPVLPARRVRRRLPALVLGLLALAGVAVALSGATSGGVGERARDPETAAPSLTSGETAPAPRAAVAPTLPPRPAPSDETVERSRVADPTRSTKPAGAAQAPSGATALPTRRFAWAPVARAVAYRVDLFRGSERVFTGRTRTAQLTLPRTWSYQGRERTLEPGAYRWIVWPIFGSGTAEVAIVQATLSITD